MCLLLDFKISYLVILFVRWFYSNSIFACSQFEDDDTDTFYVVKLILPGTIPTLCETLNCGCLLDSKHENNKIIVHYTLLFHHQPKIIKNQEIKGEKINCLNKAYLVPQHSMYVSQELCRYYHICVFLECIKTRRSNYFYFLSMSLTDRLSVSFALFSP